MNDGFRPIFPVPGTNPMVRSAEEAAPIVVAQGPDPAKEAQPVPVQGPTRPVDLSTHSPDGWPIPRTVKLENLEAELAQFFKDSPWRVTVKETGGKLWYRWQRLYRQYDSPKVTEGKLITLVPVDEENMPLLFPSPSLLLIPMPANYPAFYIDSKDFSIRRKRQEGDKEYVADRVHYLAVPQTKLSSSNDGIPIKVDGYWEEDKYFEGPFFDKFQLEPVYTQPDDERVNAMLYYDLMPIIYHVISRNMKLVLKRERPKPPKPVDTVIVKKQPESVCAIYDTSASMGTYPTSSYHQWMSWSLRQHFATSLPLEERLREIYGKAGMKAVVDELARTLHPVRMFLVDGGVHGVRDSSFSLTNSIDREKLEAWLKGEGRATLAEAVPVFGGKQFEEWLERNFDRLAGGAKLFVNRDVEPEILKDIIGMCNPTQPGSYGLVTDTGPEIKVTAPAPVVVYGNPRGDKPIVKTISNPFLELYGVKWSLNRGLPLFVFVVLADQEMIDEEERQYSYYGGLSDEASKAINRDAKTDKIKTLPKRLEAVSQTYLYHMIPAAFRLPPEDRSSWHEALKTIAENQAYDTQVKRRAIALLAAWGVRGDDRAKTVLRELFSDPQNLDLGCRLYLAKSMSLFLTNSEAKDLLAKVKSEPTNSRNAYFLTALAGHHEYTEALEFMLDEVWSTELVTNPDYGSLQQSFQIMLNDPLIDYPIYQEASQDLTRKLAGTPWRAEDLQRMFEMAAEEMLPSFAIAKEALAAVGSYATKYLEPLWEEGRVLKLNPVPVKRFWYRQSPKELESNLRLEIRNARWEESWVHFKTEGEEGLTFENGILHTEGTVRGKTDWDFIGEKLSESKGDVVLALDVHIHPPIGMELPEHMLIYPSDNDFFAWFQFMIDVRARYPRVKPEFWVQSPQGVTKVKPTDDLITTVDRLIEASGGNLQSIKIPGDLKRIIRNYKKYLLGTLDYAQKDKVKRKLRQYFEIKFPILRGL